MRKQPQKVRTGKVVIKVNGQEVARVSMIPMAYSTNFNYIKPAIRKFLDLLAKTGNIAAVRHLVNNEPIWAQGTLNIGGTIKRKQLDSLRKQFTEQILAHGATYRTPIINDE